jgi:hypothetical protein
MANAPSSSGSIDFGMDYDPEIFLAQVAKERDEMQKKEAAEDSSEDDEEETSELMSSWMVFLKAEAEKKEEEVSSVEDIVKACKHCNQSPCVINSGLYEEIMCVGEGMEEVEANNKEIRHALYRLVVKKLFGKLGPGVRKQIPQCIMSEIKDAYPAEKGTEYVGFKDAAAETD